MSTDYYSLKHPITSIASEIKGEHGHIRVWADHALIGELTVPCLSLPVVLRLFFDTEDQWFASASVKTVTFNDRNEGRFLAPETILLSEYGVLTTVGELKKEYESNV